MSGHVTTQPAALFDVSSYEAMFPVIRGSWLDGKLVYHRREEEFTRWYNANGERQSVWSVDVERWEVRSCCGLLLDWWTRAAPDNHGRYTTLSRRNADLIARPCKRCVPDA
jgi:hypothetical protein